MNLKLFSNNPIYLLTLSIIITSILIVLLFGTIKLEKDIEKRMFKIATEDIISISKNITSSIEYLLKSSDNYISTIQKNPMIQKDIESKLRILTTENIKYSYLLYKDQKGTFRFLADAAEPEVKAFLNQKFDVDNPNWLKVYKTKKPTLINHTILQELSITYIIPIIKNNEVKLLLAIDFSINKISEINKIIYLMEKGLLAIIIIAFTFILILIIQLYKYKKIKKSAFIDMLTNVFNKNYLHEMKDTIDLDKYILAVLDIDHFKKINDTYGHDSGDMILKQLASILKMNVRDKEDIIIRFGGEEFILLIKKDENKNHNIALNVINRIFVNIQRNSFFISNDDCIKVTASIGINLTPNKNKNFDKAFKSADEALYEAKESGRNNIKIA